MTRDVNIPVISCLKCSHLR